MYLERFLSDRDIAEETKNGYKTAVNKYTEYYSMTLEELIDEAINEEDNRTPKRTRSLKPRLSQFRTYLVTEKELGVRTINQIITRLITVYKYFEVDTPEITALKYKEPELTYLDLPNKNHIKEAYKSVGIRLGSLILFMASSGTGRTECANLTIGDFITGCEGYYKEKELNNILEELSNSLEQIVPTFRMFRVKTNKSYYTFCTPEATQSIVEWLLLKREIYEENNKELSWDDKIWDLTTRQISYHFKIINDELDYGFKNKYRFFRPHSLRKFHASNIGLSAENVDFLQGRSKDKIHATYIKANPQRLKDLYMSVMDNVTIKEVGHKEIIHEDFTININLNFYGKEFGVNI